MKKIFLLTILLSALKIYSQDGTIHIKKPEPSCSFELIVDSSMTENVYRINQFYIKE
jgi:hypothetical protein